MAYRFNHSIVFGSCIGVSLLALSACSGSDTLTGPGGNGGNGANQGGSAGATGNPNGGAPGAGGAGLGGTVGTGGAVSTGGTTTSTGGTTTSAAGGTASTTGGTKGTGGTLGTGGTSSATGGTKATGGTNAAAGGMPATGGSKATGGTVATGGTKATGGTPATGGSKGTGGAPATGGAKATGGSSTTTGLGAWTTGYVATMYGNVNSGDCSGYSSFSDNTNYNSQTCPNVTKASFQSGVANNASYYAALGDLSGLWGSAPQCQCQGGGTGNCTSAPSCPGESASGGACGMCIAVKCDPNGTFSSGGTHDADCNTTTYVVVQNIDACPHNHPTNVASSIGWCTSRQAQHIDLSCSGLGDISTLGTGIGRDGWLNVAVQQVNCSMGLGKHSL